MRFAIQFAAPGMPTRCACLRDGRLLLFARRSLAAAFTGVLAQHGIDAAAVWLRPEQIRDLLEAAGVEPGMIADHCLTVETETAGPADAYQHVLALARDFADARLGEWAALVEATLHEHGLG